MPSENQLRKVGEDRYVDENPKMANSATESAATAMLLLGLRTLSQRAVVAVSHLFTLLTCFSAYLLWRGVLPNPTGEQLVGVGLYGVFILLLHLVRRRPAG